ncbi:MAG: hypothetical protein JOZ15_10810 [Acidobacteria bacterium]|nr:hypothetical protein [Acidobacteriota bacterium]
MAAIPAQLSVTAPIQPAIERVKHLLFRPFNLAKWFTIGFCAWLAQLGENGFNGGYVGRFPSSPHLPRASDLPGGQGPGEWWGQARDEVMRNLSWIVPLAVVLAGLAIVIGVLVIWLSSRGEFMFLHCVALDRAEVEIPWRQHAGKAWSLFLFRLAIGLIAVGPALLLLAAIVFLAIRIFRHEAADPGGWLALIAAALVLFVVGLGIAIVAKLTRDLVVPIMFLRGGTCREAWRELLALFRGEISMLVLYLLFQIVIGLAIGAVVLVIVVATCCLAGCLLAIPYLGTVVLLPIIVFKRAYSLYYLAQLGPRYDVFQPAAPTPPSLPAIPA